MSSAAKPLNALMSENMEQRPGGGAKLIAPPWTLPLERDDPAVEEALGAGDLLHDPGRDRRVRGDDHHRQLAAAPVLAGRLPADRGGGDVDPVGAERAADAADHPGHVAVAEQGEVVVVELEVE